ncbi:polysaccharide lyase [Adhaeribacter soli]|uniref:Heparin lyase I family protein n=1 Tax=Adhaeribacter soli TaxID=2607655 RepID=A0A5N1IKL2_9BACT|nr:polysaccharide lyase [Adhaeribacter soli]KAA9325646.1 hypothetical protein F0P94_17065 [Adhaeribacter soli]
MNTKLKPFLALALFGVLATSCDKKEIDEAAKPSETSASSAKSANLIYEETMEGSSPFSTAHGIEAGSMSYGLTYVTNPVFTGKKAARFELRETDPLESTGKRVEVTIVKGSEGDIQKDTWYSFSQYLPTDYAKDKEPEVINQWFQGSSPATALRIKDDTYHLHTGNSLSPDNRQYISLGPVAKGQWTQFVLHFIHSNGSDGLIEVWRNGTKILTHKGGNMYSGELPKWKVGVYKSAFKYGTSDVDKRVLYYDDIRVGNANATLAEMMGSATTAPAPAPTEPAPAPAPTEPAPAPAPTEPAPAPAPTGQQVVSFTLVNAETNKDIMTIANGAAISLSTIKTSKVNIRANTSPSTVGSVYFALSGAGSKTRSDESFPYSLMGDSKGDYYNWTPAAGTYTLKGTAYTGGNKTGTAGTTLSINFTVKK